MRTSLSKPGISTPLSFPSSMLGSFRPVCSFEVAGYSGPIKTVLGVEEINKFIDEKAPRKTLEACAVTTRTCTSSSGGAGLSGRKFVIDTHSSWGVHTAVACSPKDPTKEDRFAASICRQVIRTIPVDIILMNGLPALCLYGAHLHLYFQPSEKFSIARKCRLDWTEDHHRYVCGQGAQCGRAFSCKDPTRWTGLLLTSADGRPRLCEQRLFGVAFLGDWRRERCLFMETSTLARMISTLAGVTTTSRSGVGLGTARSRSVRAVLHRIFRVPLTPGVLLPGVTLPDCLQL